MDSGIGKTIVTAGPAFCSPKCLADVDLHLEVERGWAGELTV
ncbi:MAG: hypothetical protein O3B22_05795 [Proteobacteria bacterium]|nr:hypothetical protein [Pseudomonadota bacterium]MDA0951189.1 hypothetical protein [Pseudomonadota bacterium]MDA1071606.1 hypothetical protein [Pseudomonadota bacterium]